MEIGSRVVYGTQNYQMCEGTITQLEPKVKVKVTRESGWRWGRVTPGEEREHPRTAVLQYPGRITVIG